jgi:hypothetical protein
MSKEISRHVSVLEVRMSDTTISTLSVTMQTLSPGVQAVVQHLCEGECHTYGSVLQWCETRGDCVYAIVCPGCARQFVVDEEELAELERWTETSGHTMVCGVRYS